MSLVHSSVALRAAMHSLPPLRLLACVGRSHLPCRCSRRALGPSAPGQLAMCPNGSTPARRAQINGGNSGGPVFNRRGQCVGIAFQALSGSDVENVSGRPRKGAAAHGQGVRAEAARGGAARTGGLLGLRPAVRAACCGVAGGTAQAWAGCVFLVPIPDHSLGSLSRV